MVGADDVRTIFPAWIEAGWAINQLRCIINSDQVELILCKNSQAIAIINKIVDLDDAVEVFIRSKGISPIIVVSEGSIACVELFY